MANDVAKVRTRILKVLESQKRFVVTGHLRPDGDSLGAMFGLVRWLGERGAEALAVSVDGVPEPYGFMAPRGDVLREFPPDPSERVLVVLDTPHPERTGAPPGYLSRALSVVNIDHHPDNDGYGSLAWVDPSASSAALLVEEVLTSSGAALSGGVASLLYVGVLTDTGAFRFNNTDVRTFDAAAKLVRWGADPAALARSVYGEQSLERVKLLGLVLASVETALGGVVSLMYLTDEMRARVGSSGDEIEGLASYGRLLHGVRVAALLREEDHRVRISLRSNGDVDVNSIARSLGGGGHRAASGAVLHGPMEAARTRLLEAVARELSGGGRGQGARS